jgi:hypothetical protein
VEIAPSSTILGDVATDKSPREQAVELLVYAPIGLALEVRELVPKLVERGRGQVVLAQLLGRVAAERGKAEVARNVARFTPPAGTTTAESDEPGPVPASDGGAPTPAPEADRAAVEAVLAGYDDLPAADIVRELADLDPDALEIVRRYEQDHRRRITILNKIDRLRHA